VKLSMTTSPAYLVTLGIEDWEQEKRILEEILRRERNSA